MKTNFPNSKQSLHIYNRGHEYSTNEHMFQEDVVSGIMPFNGESKNFLNFKVKFTGKTKENKDAINICKSFNSDSYRHDETDIICDCIENIARSLSWSAEAIYEIIINEEKDKLYFSEVTPANIYPIPFGLLQIQSKLEDDQKKYAFLQDKNLWTIKIPCILGGKNGYKGILHNLKKFNSFGPKFSIESNEFLYFIDHATYRHKNHIFNRKATLNWGWDLRDIDREDKTEIYQYYQDLTFFWAQAVLRDHIVNELNSLFIRLEINSKIELLGIPTPKEILEFRKEMIDGNKSFNDVLKFIFY